MALPIGSHSEQDDAARPGRTTTALDDRLSRAVGRLPIATAFTLAALVYVAVGLVLPVVLRPGIAGAIGWNASGALVAWGISTTSLFTRVQATRRRLLLDWATDIRRLTASEFEALVGEVLRREGWTVEETGRSDGPDGNIDLRARRVGRDVIVQCKRWESKVVGVDEVRKLAGTVARERLPLGAGMLVTLSEFSESAVNEARQVGIELVDNRSLHERIERARRPEPCPVCGSPMLLSRSWKGWWLRCPRYAIDGCAGKRDLGTEPDRVVDLLLDRP